MDIHAVDSLTVNRKVAAMYQEDIDIAKRKDRFDHAIVYSLNFRLDIVKRNEQEIMEDVLVYLDYIKTL